MDARTILIRPVISEKSYALIAEGKYTFRVNDRAHKTQIAQAVEEVFGAKVAAVRTAKVRPKPKRPPPPWQRRITRRATRRVAMSAARTVRTVETHMAEAPWFG